MGFFRFLSNLDCRSNDLHNAIVVDETLPGKTIWPEPQYHGFMLRARGGRKVRQDDKRKGQESATAEVSHNDSFGSNLSKSHDDTGSNHSFHDASKSPLPSPRMPLKSILSSSLAVNRLMEDDMETINAVASLDPSVGGNTLYSMDISISAVSMHRRKDSTISVESSVMDMSHFSPMQEEVVEFESPSSDNSAKGLRLLEALLAIDASKIVAANEEIEQEESRLTYDNLAVCEDEPMQEAQTEERPAPRKISSVMSNESNTSNFTYADIAADHVDPEHSFQCVTEEKDESEHSRNCNNYIQSYLIDNGHGVSQRRASIASVVSDLSSLTFMTKAQVEKRLEAAVPERIHLSSISNVKKATKIANKIRKLRYRYSKEYSMAKDDGNSSFDLLTINSYDGTVKPKCLVLLLDPKRRTYDFIHVNHFASTCTAQDLLDQIPLANTTDFGLRFQRYSGLVHGAIHDNETLTVMRPHKIIPDRFSVLFDEQESPLVAIPEGLTPAQAHALARILFAGKQSLAKKAFDEMQEFLLSGLDF